MCSLVAVRGLTRALSTPLGLEPAGLTAVGFDLGVAGYDGRTGTPFKERILREITALPGSAAAAMTNALPMTPSQNNESVYPDDGLPLGPPTRRPPPCPRCLAGYFAVAGTRLLAGRDVLATDRITTTRVAVVNSAFARRVMGTTNPVGKRFRFGSAGNSLIEVVGLVETGQVTTRSTKSRVRSSSSQSTSRTTPAR